MTTLTDEAKRAKPVVLVTGIAGFIGFHLARRLLAEGHPVVGIDNLNDYYDVELKLARLRQLGFSSEDTDRAGRPRTGQAGGARTGALQGRPAGQGNHGNDLCGGEAAAGGAPGRPGRRALFAAESLGLRGQQHHRLHEHPGKLPPASGASTWSSPPHPRCTAATRPSPSRCSHNVDHPLSLYAASKKANELMAHSYSHLFAIPATGLRFFTVYGPWGRPDMALFIFTRKILRGEAVEVYNFGDMKRDFTYIDDIVEGIWRVLNKPPRPDPGWDAPMPDPGHVVGPLPAVQHRQQPSGRPAAFHRAHREEPGPEGREDPAARCSRATCARPAPISRTCAATWASPRPPPSRREWRASSSGIAIIMARNRWLQPPEVLT